MIKRVTEYFEKISESNNSLLKQFTPDTKELDVKEYETLDPLDERRHMVSPRLIHRYRDRVLLLVTDSCLMYCRHCFRRDYVDKSRGDITDKELVSACKYISENRDIHEVLLSGGDPLILNPERLRFILTKIRAANKNIIIRVGSRIPIVKPDHISDELVSVLRDFTPVWLSIQCNHADELTADTKIAIDKLINSGINIVNQSVLLKGINDTVKDLKELCHKLLEFRIKPYYIFQGDLARGTSHLRVPLSRGLELIKGLRVEVSGLAMPTYAVDIPGGGGKVHLTRDNIVREDENFFYIKNSEGFIGKYPKE